MPGRRRAPLLFAAAVEADQVDDRNVDLREQLPGFGVGEVEEKAERDIGARPPVGVEQQPLRRDGAGITEHRDRFGALPLDFGDRWRRAARSRRCSRSTCRSRPRRAARRAACLPWARAPRVELVPGARTPARCRRPDSSSRSRDWAAAREASRPRDARLRQRELHQRRADSRSRNAPSRRARVRPRCTPCSM